MPQVKAVDSDPDDEVVYSQLIGDEVAEKSFALDETSGQISVKDNHLLDREQAEGQFDRFRGWMLLKLFTPGLMVNLIKPLR